MKKGKTLGQILDILLKIVYAFVILLSLYFIGEFVENVVYHYFILPLVSFITVFICGINVGKSLEKIKHNESVGFFTKSKEDNKNEKTEFIINDSIKITTNKKVLKEFKDGDKVHLKSFNYDDIDYKE